MRWQDPRQAADLEQALEQLLDVIGDRDEEIDEALALRGLNHGLAPALDLTVDPKGYRLVVELPGVDPATLKVTAAPCAIILEGQWGSGVPTGEGNALIAELRRGPFCRVIDLPGPALGDEANAELENGVLVFTVPCGEQASTTSIDVEVG